MDSRPRPLSTLLSQALVAFTIEFDNEFERQMPHRTTKYGATDGPRQGPWLVSMVMWSNCMRFVSEAGVTVGELENLAGTKTNLNGMQRWGYIVVAPDPADPRSKPSLGDWVIRPTTKGRKAQEVWRPLSGYIEERWETRFGKDAIEELRESLRALVRAFPVALPECLPILGYGLRSQAQMVEPSTRTERDDGGNSRLSLPALFSKALLAFTLDFERKSAVSLAIAANVLRLVDESGVPVRELPRLAAVSKESIAMALGFLERCNYAVVGPESRVSGAKVLVLTPEGRDVQNTYRQRVWAIEQRWCGRFGERVVGRLREALERLVAESSVETPLVRGLEPYPDGWRASVPRPGGLPHHPMILHRGGFPDGS